MTVEANPLVDVLRLCAVLGIGVVVGLLVPVWRRANRYRLLSVGVVLYALPVALTEIQQLGKPLLWWRLPLVLLADAVTVAALAGLVAWGGRHAGRRLLWVQEDTDGGIDVFDDDGNYRFHRDAADRADQ